MNLRERFHTEKTDIILRHALKHWVDSESLPGSRREELVRTAQAVSMVGPGKFGLLSALRAVGLLMLHGLAHGGDRDPLWAYAGTGESLNASNSPFHISMLQLSTLYLTPLRLGVSSFVL
ncbi:MAG: hypothetical protein P8X64_07815 [Anaerolineales bacterium]|jgi:hypothetical protein